MGDSFIPVPWGQSSLGDDSFSAQQDQPGSQRGGRDGGAHTGAPPGHAEVPGKGKFDVKRVGTTLLITASGEVPNVQTLADLRQLEIRIWPPQFGLFFYTPPITSPAVRRFNFTEHFGFPLDVSHVVIHSADGPHAHEISDVTSALAPTLLHKDGSAHVKTGYGPSLQAALDHAVAQFTSSPLPVPDGFVVYSVLSSGRIQGGLAGIDRHYATVEAKATLGLA